MFEKLQQYKISAEKTLQLAGSKLKSIFTYKRGKRSRDTDEQTEEEEEPKEVESTKRRKVSVKSSSSTFLSPFELPPSPIKVFDDEEAVPSICEIDEMASRCRTQRCHAVEMLYITCKHLFQEDLYACYLIFSLAVYLFDAFTLHQFKNILDSKSRSNLCKFSNAALYNTNCALAPPWHFCCLIMAAKLDTGHSIRLYREFVSETKVMYYFEAHKYYDSRVSFPESYVIFTSDNKEGKNFRYVDCLHVDDANGYDEDNHPARRILFETMHTELLVPAYAMYLRKFEFHLLTRVLPFHPKKERDAEDKEGGKNVLSPEWIFPNPCLFRHLLLQQQPTQHQPNQGWTVLPSSQKEREEENRVFREIGEKTRVAHQSEFSFGSSFVRWYL